MLLPQYKQEVVLFTDHTPGQGHGHDLEDVTGGPDPEAEADHAAGADPGATVVGPGPGADHGLRAAAEVPDIVMNERMLVEVGANPLQVTSLD